MNRLLIALINGKLIFSVFFLFFLESIQSKADGRDDFQCPARCWPIHVDPFGSGGETSSKKKQKQTKKRVSVPLNEQSTARFYTPTNSVRADNITPKFHSGGNLLFVVAVIPTGS
jgi:hypothetical protein